MATSFFYIYIKICIDIYFNIYFDIYITFTNWRPVVLLNAIFSLGQIDKLCRIRITLSFVDTQPKS